MFSQIWNASEYSKYLTKKIQLRIDPDLNLYKDLLKFQMKNTLKML